MADQPLRQLNVAQVQRFLDAINANWDIAAMADLVSDDFQFIIPFAPDWFPVRYDGKAAALEFLDSVRELMEPENLHDLAIDTLANDPNEVVAEYRSDTLMKGTGLPYQNSYVGRFTVRNGRISRFAEHLDPIRFVIAIGGRIDPPPDFSLASV
jgi:ketosteroid isomerase-like protein